MTATTGAAGPARQKTAKPVTMAAFLVAALAAAPGLAAVTDRVPLPHLRPHLATDRRGPAPLAPAQPGQPAPIAAAPGRPLTQADALANISNYFNSFRSMEGQFVQVGPNGEKSEGTFFLTKPGKIRFHYRPPTRLDVIADGQSVAVRDLKANTQDMYPLSKTPLRYLLADHMDLASGNLVKEVRADRDTLSVVIVEKSAYTDGQLTLIFDRRTYELKQWIVTDAQGLNTSVAVYNVSLNKREDPGLFFIDMAPTR